MKDLALAIIPTFLVWVITVLTTGTSLPLFTLYLIYVVSYLMTKEVRQEGSK